MAVCNSEPSSADELKNHASRLISGLNLLNLFSCTSYTVDALNKQVSEKKNEGQLLILEKYTKSADFLCFFHMERVGVHCQMSLVCLALATRKKGKFIEGSHHTPCGMSWHDKEIVAKLNQEKQTVLLESCPTKNKLNLHGTSSFQRSLKS